jgi:kumamolisin
MPRTRIPANYQPLAGSERPPHPKASHLGAADANQTAQIQLIVRRRPGGPPLKDLDYFQRTPIHLRELPTREQFEHEHGANQADLDAVEAFCRSHQLEVVESSRSRRSVVARGTLAQLNAAFAVELQYYQSPHGKYHGYEGTANLPTSLAAIVEGVSGLDDRPVRAKHLGSPYPGNVTYPLSPVTVAGLYNFPSGTGAGQTIGIFTAWESTTNDPTVNTNGYQLADITATLKNWGITAAAAPTNVPANPGTPNEFYWEPIMDITVATAVAPQATIAVYFEASTGTSGPTATDIKNTLHSMIHPTSDPKPTVLSISYEFSADDETSYLLPQDYTDIDTLFQEAANLGITVVTGCSDTGPYFDNPNQAQTVYPSTDPYVLTCGGTAIGDINGSNSTNTFGTTHLTITQEPPGAASAPFGQCLLTKRRLLLFPSETEPEQPVAVFLTWRETPARIAAIKYPWV